VFLIATFASADASFSWESIDKCTLCRAGCNVFQQETKQKLCQNVCDMTVCSTQQEAQEIIGVSSSEEFLGMDKCSLCNMGCSFFKKEEDRKKCTSVCGFTACKKEAQSVSSTEEFLGLDKCSICNIGCGLFKNEKDEQKCKSVCSITVCSNSMHKQAQKKEEPEEEEPTSEMADSSVESSLKVNKCKLCKAGCSFLKKEADQSKCSALCDAIFCNDDSTPVQQEETTPAADSEVFATKPDSLLGRIWINEAEEVNSDSEFKINVNKCKLCKAGCEFFKKEDSKNKCNTLCDAVLCNDTLKNMIRKPKLNPARPAPEPIPEQPTLPVLEFGKPIPDPVLPAMEEPQLANNEEFRG